MSSYEHYSNSDRTYLSALFLFVFVMFVAKRTFLENLDLVLYCQIEKRSLFYLVCLFLVVVVPVVFENSIELCQTFVCA